MHDLKFAENLFANRRLGINQDDLWIQRGSKKKYVDGLRRRGLETFIAIMFPVGICSTLTTLPPFP